jgi:hypothetical protein
VDLLRNLFGNVTSGIIRLAVAAGILVLCYLFIVKPVLNTTENVVHQTGLDKLGKSLENLGPEIKRQVNHSFRVTKVHGGNTQKLVHCVQRANGDVNRIHRCTIKF